jgi:signal transduction histidine kinase
MAAVRESVAILRPLRDADGEVVDHEIEWVNDAWKRIFGWVGRDPVGQRAFDIRREFAGLLPIHRRVLARGGSEGVTLDLDGARWLEIDFSRLGDRLLAVTRDVTELRAAQERAAKAERHETLARLATGLAHEFNNQLSVLQGRLELLEDQPLGGSARDDLAAMRTATARVHRITETLVAAAQRQILAPRPTELVALVTALAPLVEPRGRAGVEVRVSTTTAEAWVLVDRDRLREAILELSRNVVDAMADDGVLSLRVGAETVPDGEEAWVVLDVGDATGAPSPEPEAVEAFGDVDLLHRLGLWGVVGLVRQSGGSVHTASTARGASFRVRLPRMPVGGDQPGTGVPAR